MRRFTPLLILTLFFTFLSVRPSAASWWPWGNDNLVTIDGVKYTTKDFKRWWKFYNDSNMSLPKTPNLYIDWLLLAREGERMHLSDDPAFKHKSRVFLMVRSLLMLQKEEIGDKINVTDQEIRARYEKRYLPHWRLVRLEFADEKTAKAARKELKDGKVTVENLEIRPPEQGGPTAHVDEWQRPAYINKQWAAIFRKLPVGGTTEPLKAQHGHFAFYALTECQKKGSDKDFAKVRKSINGNLWEEQKNALTAALVFRLRDKFAVKVDEKRLAALDINKPLKSYSDKPIITSSQGNVSEKQFMALLLQDQKIRSSKKKQDPAAIKKRVVNGIISQNVTDWEALARHYEKHPPIKWAYQFNVKHRLTLAVENRLIATLPPITKDDIKKYYAQHVSNYTQPEMVDVTLVPDKKGEVDRIWAEVAAGTNFTKALKKFTNLSPKPASLPIRHMNPEMQKVVNGLAVGETSRPFTVQGKRFLVHLAKRTPARAVPLAQLEKTLRTTIRKERIRQMAKKYLGQLKSRSKIKINESNWQEIQKELGGTSK